MMTLDQLVLLLLLCFTRPHPPFSSAAVVGNLICNAIAGLTRTLRENADDAEVVPPAASHRIAFHGLTIFWRDIVSMSAAVVRDRDDAPPMYPPAGLLCVRSDWLYARIPCP